jgi:hypothetical protein
MSSYGLTASGAEQKHVTLPMDFRSLPETGHSRYGDPTARFAPKLPSASAAELTQLGGFPLFACTHASSEIAPIWVIVADRRKWISRVYPAILPTRQY